MTKEEFVKFDNNWNSHRPLLWAALESTNGLITNGLVMEFGCGMGSTPYLFSYCFDHKREFNSYENNLDWAAKMHDYPVVTVQDWSEVELENIGLLFIDHAPGERRKIDIARWANHAQVIVAHDTEPAADHGYQMRSELSKFKYMIDFKTDGAWASAVSNFIDLTKWEIEKH